MPIPKDFMKPARLSAKERAFLQLQEWIINGTLQPLEKLNDAELATALGVSRTPVREALQLLNAQGFVEMHPGVATQVTAVNGEDVDKILPVLASLHALAAEQMALLDVDQSLIEQLRSKNKEFAQAIQQQNFYLALKLDEELHTLIIQKVNNEYIANPIANFQAHVRRLFFHNSIILTEESVAEHERLIQAFENQDALAAHMITKKNWVRAAEEYASRQIHSNDHE
ncbi:GntR family transcriptional regulator [Kurthia senegalensis]|uniref:GntR family transcriptional regulator n=1 Tax=Kurthia senegalensis TaxID=1033740 RepID=UPI000289B09C|nr:GntR family transcriptional regulator [Kurthia senegalensis]